MKARRRHYDRIMSERHGHGFCWHPEEEMRDIGEKKDLGWGTEQKRECALCGAIRTRYTGKLRAPDA